MTIHPQKFGHIGWSPMFYFNFDQGCVSLILAKIDELRDLFSSSSSGRDVQFVEISSLIIDLFRFLLRWRASPLSFTTFSAFICRCLLFRWRITCRSLFPISTFPVSSLCFLLHHLRWRTGSCFGRLQAMADQLAPSNWVELWRSCIHPLILIIRPAIEMDAYEAASYLSDSCGANKLGIHQISCFNPHSSAQFWDGSGVRWLEKSFGSGHSFLLKEVFIPKEPVAFVVHRWLETYSVRLAKPKRSDTSGRDVATKFVAIFVLFIFKWFSIDLDHNVIIFKDLHDRSDANLVDREDRQLRPSFLL